jgi:phospholipid transport system substrate-binding protein
MVIRHLLCAVVALGMMVDARNAPRAAVSADPVAFIDNLANHTLRILGEHLAPAESEQRFKALLLQNFDMPRISRFVLSRYWLTASSQEKEEFQGLLPNYVARSYSKRFASYSGETVKVSRSRPAGEGTTVVSSQIVSPSGAPPVSAEWWVVRTGDDLRIIDVIVDGVSLVLTLRQEFVAVIEQRGGGVSTLNRMLREKLGSSQLHDDTIAAPTGSFLAGPMLKARPRATGSAFLAN